MKYKVGDIVKLRDDLEFGKYYGGMQLSETFHGGIIGKKGKIKRCASYGYWTMFKGGRVWCDITDEMIEGLWEERKPKLKLIDVLNKIANGELKEGTKIKWDVFEYTYREDEFKDECLERKDSDNKTIDILEDMYLRHLDTPVELIEPQEPKECEHEWKIGGIRDTIDPLEVVAFQHCEKCGMTKIMETKKQENHKEAEHFREDTKMIEPTECEHEWKRYSLGRLGQRTENHRYCSNLQDAIIQLTDKLNEVINKVNAQTVVVLSQEKDIEEIKNQLYY